MADAELLQRLMEERGQIATPPEPELGAWLYEVVQAWFLGLLGGASIPATVGIGGAVVLGVVAVGIVQLALWSERQRREAEAVDPVVEAPLVAAKLENPEALLAAGRCREAARAGWLGMVQGLVERGVGEIHVDQTHGDFVRLVARTSPEWPARTTLSQLAGEADLLCYGPAEPERAVVALWLGRAGTLGAG